MLQGIEERAPGLIGRRAPQRLAGGASVPEIAADEGAFDLVAAQDGTLGGVCGTRRLALREAAAGRTLVDRTAGVDGAVRAGQPSSGAWQVAQD